MKRLHRKNEAKNTDGAPNIEEMQIKMLKKQDQKLVSLESHTSMRLDQLANDNAFKAENTPVFAFQRET